MPSTLAHRPSGMSQSVGQPVKETSVVPGQGLSTLPGSASHPYRSPNLDAVCKVSRLGCYSHELQLPDPSRRAERVQTFATMSKFCTADGETLCTAPTTHTSSHTRTAFPPLCSALNAFETGDRSWLTPGPCLRCVVRMGAHASHSPAQCAARGESTQTDEGAPALSPSCSIHSML